MALPKLQIISYADQSYSGSGEATFEVLINPQSYQVSQTLHWTENQAQGSAEQSLDFNKMGGQDVTMELIFDGTGLVPTIPTSLKGKTVSEQIKLFRAVTTKFNGDEHRPNYLKLSWGDFTFYGVLASLNLTYSVFDSSGNALRAKANCTFKSSVSAATAAALENKNSPDMTHVRTMHQGQSLWNMCSQIYKDPEQYIMVARSNGLDQFRRVKPGRKLHFPPLDDK